MKKTMPVLFFLMLLLLSPTMSWAADESDAGGNSGASVEQEQDAIEKVKKEKKAKKEGKKSDKGGDEEPDCE